LKDRVTAVQVTGFVWPIGPEWLDCVLPRAPVARLAGVTPSERNADGKAAVSEL
jgi:hypothetical protein